MLPPDQLTSDSSIDILTIESDSISNGFNMLEAESSIVLQPDLSLLTGNLNSEGNHWFHNLEGPGYHYINMNGSRYYEYADRSNIFCDPHDGGLVRYKSPSGEIEKEVRGKGSILQIMKRSNAGLMLHVFSPLPLGKSQNYMYRKYVSESNQNL